MLEAFDVDPSAEAVYLAMLQHPDATLPELGARLGLDDAAVRAAFDELGRLTLLRPSWEDPRTLRPVAPEICLESLLARQQAELIARRNRIEEGRAALAILVADLARARPNVGQAEGEEIIGLDAVRERLERLTHATRHEVLSLMPDGAQTAAAIEASRPLDESLLDRGVEMRNVYLDSVRNDPPSTAYARWMTELGGQVRTAPVLPLRMIIVDREIAVVPLNPARTGDGAALLRGPGAVAAMCALFDQVWTSAIPLGAPLVRTEQGLTGQEQALLRLLSQGETDESAARKLGISPRTLRRMTAELMTELGVRSRFQWGAQAVEHGWLAPLAPKSDPAPTGIRTKEPV
jgi:DNA-binding CsgD family transcriptional regulator